MRARGPIAAVLGIGLAGLATPAFAQVGKNVSFSKDVLPIFQRRCQSCHGIGNSAGLKLDSFETVSLGATSGAVIQPGAPDQSKLYTAVSSNRMPPANPKLTTAEKAIIRAWIFQGAKNEAENPTAGAEKPLEIVEPKDGAQVREKVPIKIARNSVPPEGFVAIYIDGRFKMALAPPTLEELEEKKLPATEPVTYVWDTKLPISTDSSLLPEDRIAKDGPHLIEIRSYRADGEEVERARSQVTLKNGVDAATNKPIRLWYNNAPVGKGYLLEHLVDLEATATQGGGGRGGFGGGFGAPAAGAAGGPEKMTHVETTKYLVSLEDLMPATGLGFWRERRESPIVITVNGTKQIVRLDNSSRYYSLTRTGDVLRSKVMERENRAPILNPLDLPGRPHRMNETFTTNMRLHLGAYIPGALNVERVEATIEGMEWQHGEECARIRVTFLAGNSKLNIKSLNISDAAFEVEQGSTVVWFSEKTNRVMRAETELTGNLVVDVAQLGGGGGLSGAGGDFGVGGSESPGYPGAPGGFGSPGGYPGAPGGFGAPLSPGAAPGAPGGFGAPLSPGAAPGAPAGAGGSSFGAHFGGAPAGYGSPPAGYGAPGASGGYPGAPGGFGSPGGGGSGVAVTTKRYFVKLKLKTQVLEEEEAEGKPSRASR
jgi:hypothetical protein